MEIPRAPIDQQLGKVVKQAPIEQKKEKAVINIFKGVVEIGKAAAMLPFYCGYAVKANGDKKEVYDDKEGNKYVFRLGIKVKYDPNKHGDLEDWLDEGDALSNFDYSTENKTAIHRHRGHAKSGVHKYEWE